MINEFLRRRLKQSDTQLIIPLTKLIGQKNKEYARMFARLYKKSSPLTPKSAKLLRIKYAKERKLRVANWEKHRQTAEQLAKDEETASKEEEEARRQVFRLQHRVACLQQIHRQKEARMHLAASLEKLRRPNLSIKPLYQIFEERYSARREQQQREVPRPNLFTTFRLKDLHKHLSWCKEQQQHRSSVMFPVPERRFSSSLGAKVYKEDQLLSEESARLKQKAQELAFKRREFAHSVKSLFRPRVKAVQQAASEINPPVQSLVQRELREWKPRKFAPNPMLPSAPPAKPPPNVVDYLGEMRKLRESGLGRISHGVQPMPQTIEEQERNSDALLSSIKAKLSALGGD